MTNPEEKAYDEDEVRASVEVDRLVNRLISLAKTGKDFASAYKVEEAYSVLQEIKKLLPYLGEGIKKEAIDEKDAEEAEKKTRKNSKAGNKEVRIDRSEGNLILSVQKRLKG